MVDGEVLQIFVIIIVTILQRLYFINKAIKIFFRTIFFLIIVSILDKFILTRNFLSDSKIIKCYAERDADVSNNIVYIDYSHSILKTSAEAFSPTGFDSLHAASASATIWRQIYHERDAEKGECEDIIIQLFPFSYSFKRKYVICDMWQDGFNIKSRMKRNHKRKKMSINFLKNVQYLTIVPCSICRDF